MASGAKTGAFLLGQVAYSAKRARAIVHVAIITSFRGNFKSGADKEWVERRADTPGGVNAKIKF